MTSRPLLSLTAHLVCAAALSATACVAAERPMVCGEPHVMADLYWNGGMTDRQGNRWDIAFMPGVAPTAEIVRDSWKRAGHVIGATGKRSDGNTSCTRDAFHFAGEDVAHQFVVKGIHDDVASTSHQLHDLWVETPFGWIPQMIGRSTWGYIIKPTGRLIGGTVTGLGAATIGVLSGSLEFTGRAIYGTGDVVAVGTVYPVGRLLWLQPSWLFSIINREPSLDQDGHWGLSIVHHATAPMAAN